MTRTLGSHTPVVRVGVCSICCLPRAGHPAGPPQNGSPQVDWCQMGWTDLGIVGMVLEHKGRWNLKTKKKSLEKIWSSYYYYFFLEVGPPASASFRCSWDCQKSLFIYFRVQHLTTAQNGRYCRILCVVVDYCRVSKWVSLEYKLRFNKRWH